MAEIRNVSISGDAAKGFAAFGGARRTRKQGGGFNSAPGPAITMGASNIANARRIGSSANAFHGGAVAHRGGAMPVAAAAADVGSTGGSGSVGVQAVVTQALPSQTGTVAKMPEPAAPTPPPNGATVMKGGAKKSLVLAPPRKTKSKVHLAPPASGKRSTKGTRKIRVQLSCMKKRLTRAKTIKAESKQKPIGELRRILEEAKLVKPRADGKQVPESVLRDIYQDYMLLRNRVL